MEEESTSSDIGVCGKTQLDSWDSRICRKFFTNGCEDGEKCVLKHVSYIREVVCKYYLLYGYCLKKQLCPFIHEIVAEKIPECKNQTGNAKCINPNCKFKHNTTEPKECLYYNLGFCKMGKFCKFKHKRRKLCRNYYETGVCPDRSCKNFHIEDSEDMKKNLCAFEEYLEQAYYKFHKDADCVSYRDAYQLCFRCMKFGHHPSKCQMPDKNTVIRCYKCMKYGHKSNACVKKED